jgi:hypothetical protein
MPADSPDSPAPGTKISTAHDTPVPASLAGAALVEGPRPPPLPARQSVAAPPPVPSADGFMSTQSKMNLADVALALRDEQLAGRVVHYKVELETNSELDAITAQVIADLRKMQAARQSAGPGTASAPVVDRTQLEIELIQSLKEMLKRLFREDKLASVLERKLAEVSKRFARLFFESELHDRIRGGGSETKTMRFAEQALFHALTRTEPVVLQELAAFDYATPQIAERAKRDLSGIIKELRNDFLARTTPELNALVKMLNDILREFFTKELPPMVGELAWEVVKEARLADATTSTGYKLGAVAFPGFRTAFERRFLQRLVPFSEDEMLKRARESQTPFRQETIRFVADPHIFSDVCELVCDAIYDVLYNDGFLDLPPDWRARLAAED